VVIFVTIFGVGFFILLMSLIFGHDVDTDTDVMDHDVSHGPSVLSLRMIALFMVGFGAVGFGMRATTTAGMMASTAAGLGGALVVGVIGYVILRAFYSSQASSTITDDDIIGVTANLVDAISEGGNGQVSCVLRGREMTFLARSKDGQPIPRGKPVRVVGKTGHIVTVEPAE
jgi:membrane protein implicated in regulation of membrane protease activity